MRIINNLKFIPRIISNKGKTPLYIIFFVTSKCNMMCDHCFFWRELNKAKNELTLDEIEKITKRMDPLLFLRMTGGEPFLRPDLSEIAALFYKNSGLRNLSINTAGFFPEAIVKSVEKILSNCKLDLDICVAIDDIGEYHDQNRGVKGAFDNAVKTVNELKKLKGRYINLIVTTVTTVTANNQGRIDEIFEELKKINPDFISATFIRGEPKDPNLKTIKIEKYMKFIDKINAYNSGKLSHSFYINSNAKNRLLSSIIYNTHVKNENQGIACIAGDKMAVIYSEGDVHLCEMLDNKIGNLRDFNFDFRLLWNSENRKNIRGAMVKRRCFCTHECFMSGSILLDFTNCARAFKKTLTCAGRQ